MPLMKEALLAWSLNGTPQPPLLCSPHQGEDLLTGYLLTEGRIRKASDILEIRPVAPDGTAYTIEANVTDACGEPLCDSPLCLSISQADMLLCALQDVPGDCGEHAALLWDGKKQVSASDISRHHALDAAVGKALRAGMDLTQCILAVSARISLEIVRKAVRAGTPAVCTRKAVGSLAAGFAEAAGCAIVHLSSAPEVHGAIWRVKNG